MTKQIQDAYIVSAVRTPVGKAPRGVFRNTRPDDMLAHVLREAIKRAPGIDASRIGDAIIGCAMPEAEQGMNVARIGVLLAGLPDSVPGMTINRFCSSGLQAIALAADRIRLGEADLMLAGGTEIDEHGADDGPQDRDESRRVFRREHRHRLRHGHHGREGRRALEDHARAAGRVRAAEPSDARSPRSPAANSPTRSRRIRSTITIRISQRATIATDSRRIDTDEGPRKDTTLEALAKLRPVFRMGGSVTAGNSSQMSDGAGAVVLASEQAIKDYGLQAARALRRLRGRRRAARDHGHRAEGSDSARARADRHHARISSTGSSSTKRSPRSRSRSCRTSASIRRR